MSFNFIPQSTHIGRKLHAAIIMDGNGRWATMRGLPRLAGHRAGADAVRRTVECAPNLGIGILTLYAFSSDNWRRPPAEVSGLMELLDIYLRKETRRCLENGVRLQVIGRRDRLDPKLVMAIERTEAATAAGATLTLRVAVDYSARDAIQRGNIGPDVDLLIRTGGEQRLSDFLLWECAYAELVFSQRMWPDFDTHDLASAVREFQARERRFGAVPDPPAAVNGNGNGVRHTRGWLD
jgi:undecaprenyl diphosphate synthase